MLKMSQAVITVTVRMSKCCLGGYLGLFICLSGASLVVESTVSSRGYIGFLVLIMFTCMLVSVLFVVGARMMSQVYARQAMLGVSVCTCVQAVEAPRADSAGAADRPHRENDCRCAVDLRADSRPVVPRALEHDPAAARRAPGDDPPLQHRCCAVRGSRFHCCHEPNRRHRRRGRVRPNLGGLEGIHKNE